MAFVGLVRMLLFGLEIVRYRVGGFEVFFLLMM